MKYLATFMGTDWPEKEPWQVKVIQTILFFIPKANAGYDSKMHLIKKWFIEFVDMEGELMPRREIALDINGNVLFAGPDNKNYGFWLDTNMRYEHFEGEPISKDEFERYWSVSGVEAKK